MKVNQRIAYSKALNEYGDELRSLNNRYPFFVPKMTDGLPFTYSDFFLFIAAGIVNLLQIVSGIMLCLFFAKFLFSTSGVSANIVFNFSLIFIASSAIKTKRRHLLEKAWSNFVSSVTPILCSNNENEELKDLILHFERINNRNELFKFLSLSFYTDYVFSYMFNSRIESISEKTEVGGPFGVWAYDTWSNLKVHESMMSNSIKEHAIKKYLKNKVANQQPIDIDELSIDVNDINDEVLMKQTGFLRYICKPFTVFDRLDISLAVVIIAAIILCYGVITDSHYLMASTVLVSGAVLISGIKFDNGLQKEIGTRLYNQNKDHIHDFLRQEMYNLDKNSRYSLTKALIKDELTEVQIEKYASDIHTIFKGATYTKGKPMKTEEVLPDTHEQFKQEFCSKK